MSRLEYITSAFWYKNYRKMVGRWNASRKKHFSHTQHEGDRRK